LKVALLLAITTNKPVSLNALMPLFVDFVVDYTKLHGAGHSFVAEPEDLRGYVRSSPCNNDSTLDIGKWQKKNPNGPQKLPRGEWLKDQMGTKRTCNAFSSIDKRKRRKGGLNQLEDFSRPRGLVQ